MPRKVSRHISILLCFILLFQQSGFAQVAGQLDISGYLTSLHQSLTAEKFRPLHLRYLSYDNLNNNFKLLLDKGDFKNPQTGELANQTKTLLNYFFVGISLPNDSFWVNLRPDSPDNIIDDYLAQTDVGKILLEADLQLKKDTASATSPQTLEGKKYWDKLYQKAEELFGNENITIPTLTRPWIVPGEIIIRETETNAYIYKATLKVMLEQDYLKDSSTHNFTDPRLKALNEYSSQLIRELITPKLTKEVNTSKRYAALRQVYYSLILSQWFKARFYGKGGLYSWLIDKKNLTNLTSKDNWSKQAYFKAYQASFKDGEYNLKEPIQTPYGQSIRSYFSGGIMISAAIPPIGGTLVNPETRAIFISISGSHSRDLSIANGNTNDKYLLGLIAAGGTVANFLPQSIEISTGTAGQGPIASSPLARPQAKEGASSPAAEDKSGAASSPAQGNPLLVEPESPAVFEEVPSRRDMFGLGLGALALLFAPRMPANNMVTPTTSYQNLEQFLAGKTAAERKIYALISQWTGGIPVEYLYALEWRESRGKRDARSGKGANGVFQITQGNVDNINVFVRLVEGKIKAKEYLSDVERLQYGLITEVKKFIGPGEISYQRCVDSREHVYNRAVGAITLAENFYKLYRFKLVRQGAGWKLAQRAKGEIPGFPVKRVTLAMYNWGRIATILSLLQRHGPERWIDRIPQETRTYVRDIDWLAAAIAKILQPQKSSSPVALSSSAHQLINSGADVASSPAAKDKPGAASSPVVKSEPKTDTREPKTSVASSPAESVFTQDGRLNLSALQQILQSAIPEAQRENVRPKIFGSAAYMADGGFVELALIDDVDIGHELQGETKIPFSHKNYAENLHNIFSQAWGEQRVTDIESFAMPHDFEGMEAFSHYYFYITSAHGHRLKITVPPSTSTDMAGFVAQDIASIVNTPENMLDKPIKRNLLLVAYLGGYLKETLTMDTLRTEYIGIIRMPEGSGKDNALEQFKAKLSEISARLKERYRSEIVGQEAELSGLTDFIRQQLHAAVAFSPAAQPQQEDAASSPAGFTSEVMSAIKILHQSGDLELENASALLADALAGALKLDNERQKAVKTAAGLLIEIIIDTTKGAMLGHIRDYRNNFSGYLPRIETVAEAKAKILKEIGIASYSLYARQVVEYAFARLEQLVAAPYLPETELLTGTSLYAVFGAIQAKNNGAPGYRLWSEEAATKHRTLIFKTEPGMPRSLIFTTGVENDDIALDYALRHRKTPYKDKDSFAQYLRTEEDLGILLQGEFEPEEGSLGYYIINEGKKSRASMAAAVNGVSEKEFQEYLRLLSIPILVGISEKAKSHRGMVLRASTQDVPIQDSVDFATEVTEIRIADEYLDELKQMIATMGLQHIKIIADVRLTGQGPRASSPIEDIKADRIATATLEAEARAASSPVEQNRGTSSLAAKIKPGTPFRDNNTWYRTEWYQGSGQWTVKQLREGGSPKNESDWQISGRWFGEEEIIAALGKESTSSPAAEDKSAAASSPVNSALDIARENLMFFAEGGQFGQVVKAAARGALGNLDRKEFRTAATMVRAIINYFEKQNLSSQRDYVVKLQNILLSIDLVQEKQVVDSRERQSSSPVEENRGASSPAIAPQDALVRALQGNGIFITALPAYIEAVRKQRKLEPNTVEFELAQLVFTTLRDFDIPMAEMANLLERAWEELGATLAPRSRYVSYENPDMRFAGTVTVSVGENNVAITVDRSGKVIAQPVSSLGKARGEPVVAGLSEDINLRHLFGDEIRLSVKREYGTYTMALDNLNPNIPVFAQWAEPITPDAGTIAGNLDFLESDSMQSQRQIVDYPPWAIGSARLVVDQNGNIVRVLDVSGKTVYGLDRQYEEGDRIVSIQWNSDMTIIDTGIAMPPSPSSRQSPDVLNKWIHPNVTEAFKQYNERARREPPASSPVKGPAEERAAVSSPAQETKVAVSSPASDKGGIDFRGLPIVTQPALINNPLLRDSPLPVSGDSLRRGQSLSSVNLDNEWQQIQKMLNAGITPSTERIKEYVQACSQNANINEEIDKVLSCIADILRLEEANCLPTEAGLKELLVSLESI